MKKSKILWPIRIAMIALTLICASTFVIGYTFSKYVRSGTNGTNNGTVAKFGVTFGEWIGNMFANTYTTDAIDDGAALAVKMDAEGTLRGLAPGTEGSSSATVTVTGNQVRIGVELVYSITLNNWDITWDHDSDAETPVVPYLPINLTYKLGDAEAVAIADLSSSADPHRVTIATVEALAGLSETTVELAWAWPFEVEGHDTLDTQLGELATAPSITINAQLVATQLA